jgi:hypothetical protein
MQQNGVEGIQRRHDWVGRIHVKEKWYEHEPVPATENVECKIQWDLIFKRIAFR